MKKPQKNGLLYGMLGTLFVILGVVGYVVFSSLLTRLFISVRFGSDAAGALMTLSMTGIIVAFVLYEAIFITWQIKLTKEASKSEDSGNMGKIMRIVALSCISLSILFAIVSANTFTELRENSISKVCFVTTKEYRWDTENNDIIRYTFICDDEGGISYNVTTKDGETIELLSGVTSLSDKFKEEYDTANVHLLKYCADLSESFSEGNGDFVIDCKISNTTIENAKKNYQSDENKALIWEQIERIIATVD